MASTKQVLLLAAVAAVACLAPLASAMQWIVGDDGGWRARFNETGWADGKTFVVGDSLMFMYPKENHTVAQVGEDDFAACNLQGNLLGLWDSGNDAVQLDEPGKRWFICTKPNHCNNGMKLAIEVVVGGDTSAPAPLPFPFPFPLPFPGAPAPQAASSPSPRQSPFPFPFPFPGVPAPAPEPSPSAPRMVQFPSPFLGPAPAQSPRSIPPWRGSVPAPTPQTPPSSPPSAAVRYPVGGAVAAAAAAVVAAALAF